MDGLRYMFSFPFSRALSLRFWDFFLKVRLPKHTEIDRLRIFLMKNCSL